MSSVHQNILARIFLFCFVQWIYTMMNRIKKISKCEWMNEWKKERTKHFDNCRWNSFFPHQKKTTFFLPNLPLPLLSSSKILSCFIYARKVIAETEVYFFFKINDDDDDDSRRRRRRSGKLCCIFAVWITIWLISFSL